MKKEKSKTKEGCEFCRAPLKDEEVMQHSGKNYCPKCMAEHIRDEHFTSEISSVWTHRRAT